MNPEYPVNNNYKAFFLAVVLMSAMSVWAIKSKILPTLSFTSTQAMVSNDINLAVIPEAWRDIAYDELYKRLANYFGSETDFSLTALPGSLDDPTSFLVTPLDGFDDFQALTWGDSITTSGDPLIDSMVSRGILSLSSSENRGVDYSTALREAFEKGQTTPINTRSGNTVSIKATSRELVVTDNDLNTPAYLTAFLNDEGLIQYNLYTRGINGDHYNQDFIASDFYDAAIEWFGEGVQGVESSMSSGSSNITTINYNLEMKRLLIEAGMIIQGGDPLMEAISETWSAQRAAENGLTEISIVSVTYDKFDPYRVDGLRVKYTKPSN